MMPMVETAHLGGVLPLKQTSIARGTASLGLFACAAEASRSRVAYMVGGVGGIRAGSSIGQSIPLLSGNVQVRVLPGVLKPLLKGQ